MVSASMFKQLFKQFFRFRNFYNAKKYINVKVNVSFNRPAGKDGRFQVVITVEIWKFSSLYW